MGEQKLVSYNRKGFIGTISLNRPDKRNAFNMRVWESLNEAISFANKDEGVRVVLLRGEGSSFSSGLELSPENEFIQAFEQPVSAEQKMHVWGMIRRVQEIFQNLAELKVPTIAVIQRHCLGAALEMVACCDLRLCSKDALFSLPEARLAIITDVGGLQRISLLVGEGKMREMAFRAHIFGAEEAFLAQLSSRGAKVVRERRLLLVTLDGAQAVQSILEAARETSFALRRLRPRPVTLAEEFYQLVQE